MIEGVGAGSTGVRRPNHFAPYAALEPPRRVRGADEARADDLEAVRRRDRQNVGGVAPIDHLGGVEHIPLLDAGNAWDGGIRALPVGRGGGASHRRDIPAGRRDVGWADRLEGAHVDRGGRAARAVDVGRRPSPIARPGVHRGGIRVQPEIPVLGVHHERVHPELVVPADPLGVLDVVARRARRAVEGDVVVELDGETAAEIADGGDVRVVGRIRNGDIVDHPHVNAVLARDVASPGILRPLLHPVALVMPCGVVADDAGAVEVVCLDAAGTVLVAEIVLNDGAVGVWRAGVLGPAPVVEDDPVAVCDDAVPGVEPGRGAGQGALHPADLDREVLGEGDSALAGAAGGHAGLDEDADGALRGPSGPAPAREFDPVNLADDEPRSDLHRIPDRNGRGAAGVEVEQPQHPVAAADIAAEPVALGTGHAGVANDGGLVGRDARVPPDRCVPLAEVVLDGHVVRPEEADAVLAAVVDPVVAQGDVLDRLRLDPVAVEVADAQAFERHVVAGDEDAGILVHVDERLPAVLRLDRDRLAGGAADGHGDRRPCAVADHEGIAGRQARDGIGERRPRRRGRAGSGVAAARADVEGLPRRGRGAHTPENS